jgi:hypothetical protein
MLPMTCLLVGEKASSVIFFKQLAGPSFSRPIVKRVSFGGLNEDPHGVSSANLCQRVGYVVALDSLGHLTEGADRGGGADSSLRRCRGRGEALAGRGSAPILLQESAALSI